MHSILKQPIDPTREIGRAGTSVYGDLTYEDSEYNFDFQWPQSMDIYDEMSRTPVVSGLLTILNLSVLSDEWSIKPASNDSSPQGEECARIMEENIRAGLEYRGTLQMHYQSFDDVLRNYLLCLIYGFSLDESVWRYDGNLVKLAKLGPRLPRSILNFIASPSNSSDLLAVEQNVYNYSSSGFPCIPANRITLCSFNRRGDNYTGISMLRPIYQPYFIKDGAIRIEAMKIERNSMGIPMIEATDLNTPKPDPNTLTEFDEIVKNLRGGEYAGFRLPPGWTLKLTGVSGTLPDVVPFLQYLDRQMAMAVCLQIMTAGLEGGGSYSQAQVQDSLGGRVISSIKTQLEGFINAGWVSQWWDYNYKGRCLRPEFHFANSINFDLNQIVDVIGKISGSGLYTASPDDEEWIRNELNLPKRQSSTQTINPAVIKPEPEPEPPLPEPELPAELVRLARDTYQPWSPARALRDSEGAIACADIRSNQDEATRSIEAVFNRYLPGLVEEIAEKISKAGNNLNVKVEPPPGLIDDLVKALGSVSGFASENTMAEIERRKRGRKV